MRSTIRRGLGTMAGVGVVSGMLLATAAASAGTDASAHTTDGTGGAVLHNNGDAVEACTSTDNGRCDTRVGVYGPAAVEYNGGRLSRNMPERRQARLDVASRWRSGGQEQEILAPGASLRAQLGLQVTYDGQTHYCCSEADFGES